MCYGWEPDDIVQIITELQKDNEIIMETRKCLMKGDECCIHHYVQK
jgi:hypothetical protein